MSDLSARKELHVHEASDLFERITQDRGIEVYLSLFQNPSSASDLATRLNMSRAKINYLLECLMQEGLVYLHSEKMNGANVAKVYASNVDTFHLLAGTESGDSQKMHSVVYMLDIMRDNLLNAINTKQHAHMGMVHVQVNKERVEEFTKRLKDLQEEFDLQGVDRDEEGKSWHTMVLSIFPGPTIE